jgi:3-methyl-2-oxobutanoate hydroxymethyltransferase
MADGVKRKQTTVPAFRARKGGEKLVVLTAYDYPSARFADEAGVDAILVGDSVNMVVHGEPTTLTATMDMMVLHTRAVSNAAKYALVIGDLPFLSATISDADAVRNAGRLIAEGGAGAVKVERGNGLESAITTILRAGIPVMGHIGLTPQSILHLGGHTVQGKARAAALDLISEAQKLEELGCFSIVLECIPRELAAIITRKVSVPTIGIGAGAGCDGQVLVWHDVMGLESRYAPRHARKFANLAPIIDGAIRDYIGAVKLGGFPGDTESFAAGEGILDNIGDLE